MAAQWNGRGGDLIPATVAFTGQDPFEQVLGPNRTHRGTEPDTRGGFIERGRACSTGARRHVADTARSFRTGASSAFGNK